ncbi:hypothetical protein FAGKG844_200006 [Frankia sp. AgKG'84/4]
MSPARRPDASDSGTHATSADAVATATVPGASLSPTSGLSPRPPTASRCRSTRSLLQPTDNCPASTADATRPTPPAVRPLDAASAAANNVTAAVGSGWHARTNAARRPATPACQAVPILKAQVCGAPTVDRAMVVSVP